MKTIAPLVKASELVKDTVPPAWSTDTTVHTESVPKLPTPDVFVSVCPAIIPTVVSSPLSVAVYGPAPPALPIVAL